MRRFTKHEIILVCIALALLCLAVYNWIYSPLSPQWRNLRAINRHIKRIQPQWKGFKNDPDFMFVELFAWTGSNGLFGAYGELPSNDHLLRIKKFMEDTNPPRPVYLNAVQVLDRESFEQMKEYRNYNETE